MRYKFGDQIFRASALWNYQCKLWDIVVELGQSCATTSSILCCQEHLCIVIIHEDIAEKPNSVAIFEKFKLFLHGQCFDFLESSSVSSSNYVLM